MNYLHLLFELLREIMHLKQQLLDLPTNRRNARRLQRPVAKQDCQVDPVHLAISVEITQNGTKADPVLVQPPFSAAFLHFQSALISKYPVRL